MNNADLDRALLAARVPERSEPYWADFPSRVVARLHADRPAPPSQRSAPPRAWFLWAGTLAVAGLAFGFAVGTRQSSAMRAGRESFAWLKNERALREVLTLFPNQVRALVQDDRGVHLVLADRPDVPASPPVWIEFEDHGHRRTTVTFSGQEIQIAGERVEVLANPQGQITLVGERDFWSSATPKRALAGQHIRAQELPAVL